MAEFKRKKGESFEGFLRRFNKGLKQSKRLPEARARQYLRSSETKAKQKKYALVSMKLRSKREYLRKIGKLPEEDIKPKRR